MRKKAFRFILSITLVAGLVFTSALLHKADVCVSRLSIASRDEKILAAIGFGLAEQNRAIKIPLNKVGGYGTYTNLTHYADADEFLSANPDCCKITRTDFSSEYGEDRDAGFLDSIVAENLDLVRVDYKSQYKDDDGNIRERIDPLFYAINNCGAAKEWSHEISGVFYQISSDDGIIKNDAAGLRK